jgi:purine nucleosidase
MKNRAWTVLLCAVGLMGTTLTAYAQGKGSAPAAKPELVLLDTDIGDDIDDAFALGLLLKSPELKVLGITTTFGDTELRARLLDRYLAAAGRSDIPVGAGPATKNDNVFTQAAYARQAPAKKHADGVTLMLDTIRAHPGQVTLIAIGPLFTVEAATEKDPETFRKLKQVILMGGSVERGYDGSKGERRPAEPEWNIARYPKGAQALFAAGVPIFMMPLDSTEIHLEAKERERIFAHGSAVTDQITLLYHQWMAGSEWHAATPTLFDPVTVAYVLNPELCPTRPMRIAVDERGMTRAVEGKPNAEVCLQSDEKGFMGFLLNRLTGAEK